MNMKSMKKAAGLLIALCMVLTMLPAAAFAAEGNGGSEPAEEPGSDADIVMLSDIEYTEYTIVGWMNEGPDGAIKSVSINGVELPETGGTMTVPPEVMLDVNIVLNDGYKIGEYFDGVVLRFGGIQSEKTNISNSNNATSIESPSEEWLSGEWGEGLTDHEIYLIIPTEEDESAVRYTLDFETNGGSDISPVTKFAGNVISLDEYTTVKSGYTFEGWYTDKELTEKVSSVTLDRNMTVYAGWTRNSGEGGTTGGGTSADKNTPASPQTGDDSSMTLWFALAAISLTGMAAAVFGRKRSCGRSR